MALVLAVIALVIAVAAAALAFLGWRGTGRTPRRARNRRPVAPDVQALRDEVEALRADARETLRHLAVIRYDAFGDMGGHLSWSVALLDDVGDGLVLTSIHGRSEARTYAKNIAGWTCDQQLSPEEDEAVATARPR
ncbi:MAG: DUF4446 family protein [Nocardioidaceae bacterium]